MRRGFNTKYTNNLIGDMGGNIHTNSQIQEYKELKQPSHLDGPHVFTVLSEKALSKRGHVWAKI